MVVFGKNPVREALNSETTIEKLLVEKGNYDASLNALISNAKDLGVFVSFVDKAFLDKTAEGGRHQGIIAITTEFNYCDVSDILERAKERNENLLIVLLDGITDPHNLGAIMRSAECFGAHGIVIPRHRACGVNSTVLKISAGAAEHLLVAKVTNINDTIRQLKEQNVWVYATDFDGESLFSAKLDGDAAIVIGNEGEGIKRLTKELCDSTVTIPQFGKVASLNASVATGVVLYECARQRTKKK
ncbi:MAG TPA: 23S rRNA (guanosine(2251)-2'-O)-methyltransferase RlmB [Clostridia bacterium]|nr:23S rRNA (guanosine(2251)-2'-O)-methyltransferase RlmB [Clostridia bacterium]